ncbi:hypothetical protein HDU87_001725 [Geranomyces variabilis]|uniref:F-box domain-containing protein n=1 Tax=Geranomyces variabilis TaxID=109894 RepID=A0AAD5XL69_9FUNG|nr:hypothetical protein HDU87_001725 [Geranomyces variabilis]
MAVAASTANNNLLVVQQIPLAKPSSALHQKLCSKKSVLRPTTPASLRSTTTRPKHPTLFPRLPNELLLVLLETMPTTQICTMRRVSKTYAALGSLVIAKRIEEQLQELAVKDVELRAALAAAQAEFGLHLDHYKQFLRGVTPSDLTEALWYSNPPEELRAICECLCRLKGLPPAAAAPAAPATSLRRRNATTTTTALRSSSSSSSVHASPRPSSATLSSPSSAGLTSLQPLPWSQIKKHMGRYEFKTWLLNLQSNVDHIPHSSIRVVEHIIMIAPDINYDHVRDVSLAGYRLLILVAACLQYANINHDLKAKAAAATKVQRTMENYKRFVAETTALDKPPVLVTDEMIALAAEEN